MLYEVWQVWFYFDNMFFFFFSWRELEVFNNKQSTQLKAQLFRFNSKVLKRKKKEKRKNYSFSMSKVVIPALCNSDSVLWENQF